MHRVLVVSYLFPPMGGVGVQRTLKFVKYLRDFGWDPLVLTARPPGNGLRDPALLNELPESISVTRTSALLLPQKLPWRMREIFTRWILTIDEQVGWLPFAVHAGQRIIREKNVDLIYSTSAPYTDHLVALRLQKQARLPWVADFRDPWVGNANLHFATPLHRRIIEQKERQVIMRAGHVLVVSPPMADSFTSRIKSGAASHFTCLPNGYDADDFAHNLPAPRERDRFTLVYTGSFYAHGRSSRSILEAFRVAIQSGRIPRQSLCLRLIGNIGKATQAWIAELGLGDIVEASGFVPHAQSISHLLAADALLLVIGDAPDSAGVYTGKLFEYLAAGKPILCLANAGVAADLVVNTRTGRFVSPEDVGLITDSLVDMFQAWQAGQLRITPDLELIRSFERKQLTGRLAGIFDGLISAGKP
jgi:glycosyltransferase involved in cell wall biosynthesis